MYERARRVLSAGVASSYQLRDPWPIYFTHGEGSAVWDVDGTRRIDFHNGFGSMVQGHAHPAIIAAVEERIRAGHPLRRANRGRDRRRRGADAPLRAARNGALSTPAPRRRWTRSASPAAYTGRDTIVKIFGSYHGHHDGVMVSIGVAIRAHRRPLTTTTRSPTAPESRRRSPTSRRRSRSTTSSAMEAPHRRARARGSEARLRDHGGGDDEPRRHPAGAGVPRRRARRSPATAASCSSSTR